MTGGARLSDDASDERAWRSTVERLYREQFQRLVAKAAWITEDRAAAEDVVQEAFVRLLHAPPRQPELAWPYLRTITARVAVDFVRGRGRDAAALGPGGGSGDTPSPEAAVMRLEQMDEVASRMAALSERDRQSLVMRAFGYSYREIGRRLDIPPGQVGAVLWRAVRKVRGQDSQDAGRPRRGMGGTER
jgi:RNA polymerase sigma factor (sigma-70 family)